MREFVNEMLDLQREICILVFHVLLGFSIIIILVLDASPKM